MLQNKCRFTPQYPKDLLETCKPNGIDLLWLDYGEPQKGMYQCDQEAAPARYVEQGNNIQSATDISAAQTSFK